MTWLPHNTLTARNELPCWRKEKGNCKRFKPVVLCFLKTLGISDNITPAGQKRP